MLTEVQINKFSQLCYLDIPAELSKQKTVTVGQLADYYTNNPLGKAYMKSRFSSLPSEYEDWINFLSNDVNDIRDSEIRNIYDDNKSDGSGFYGCTYYTADGDIIVAFRGSEMLGNRRYQNDYRTDFALTYKTETAQQKEVKRYLDQNPVFSRRGYYITGHSLGGNLAVYGALNAPVPALVKGCYAFNAPGFNYAFISKYKKEIEAMKSRIFLLQNQHDIISSLMVNVVTPEIIVSKLNPDEMENPDLSDIFLPHSNFMMESSDGRFIRKRLQEKDRMCQLIHSFSLMFLRLPNFVKYVLSTLILEKLYAAISPKKKTQYMLESITKYLVQNNVADQGGDAVDFGASIYNAVHLFDSGLSTEQLYNKLMQGEMTSTNELAAAGLIFMGLLQERCVDGKCDI